MLIFQVSNLREFPNRLSYTEGKSKKNIENKNLSLQHIRNSTAKTQNLKLLLFVSIENNLTTLSVYLISILVLRREGIK